MRKPPDLPGNLPKAARKSPWTPPESSPKTRETFPQTRAARAAMRTFNKDRLIQEIHDAVGDEIPIMYVSGFEDVNHILDVAQQYTAKDFPPKIREFMEFGYKHYKKDSIYIFYDPKLAIYTIQRAPFDPKIRYYNRLRITNGKKLLKLVKKFLSAPKLVNRECMICYEELVLSDLNMTCEKKKVFNKITKDCYNNPFKVTCTRCQNIWCFKCNFKMMDELPTYCCPFCRNEFASEYKDVWLEQKHREFVHTTHEYLVGDVKE